MNMKKLLLSLVAATVAATASFAQSSLLATLSHVEDGTITTYYGATALREAHAAAADGDIITLSSGSFNSVEITKGITLRGAGMDFDAATQSEPTILVGDFNVSIPEETTQPLTIEGVYSDNKMYVTLPLNNATFLKSRIKNVDSKSNSTVFKNLTMIHCKISSQIYCASGSTINCINCIIWNPVCSNKNSVFEMTNCVVMKENVGLLYSSTFKNCIFIGNNGPNFFNYYEGPNTVYNCVGLDYDTERSIFRKIQNNTNSIAAYADVMKTCKDGTYSDSETFELTDAAKTQYLGTDGTQVGIYGGSMPFSITPSNPQITKANVAAKSTADGKLSIDITVKGAE